MGVYGGGTDRNVNHQYVGIKGRINPHSKTKQKKD